MTVLRVTHTKYWSQEESRMEKLRSLCGAGGGRRGAGGAFPNRPKKLLPLFLFATCAYMCLGEHMCVNASV